MWVLGGAVAVTVCWAVALLLVDEKRRRLPDLLTLPAAAGAAFGAAVTDPILLLGGLGWAGLYLLLGVSFGGVGGGDVKLGLSLGILAAAAGGTAAWFVAVLGASVVTVLRGALTRRKAVAHGPSMLLSTAFAVGMWFGV